MASDVEQLQWTIARDGSRTGLVNGAWLGGCSVPKRSAELMLRNLVVTGRSVCLLLPTHPQQIAACLERIDPTIALIVLLADASEHSLIEPCLGQLTQPLLVAWDRGSLAKVFADHPGLPIPRQFVRLPVAAAGLSDQTIAWAQQVFGEVAQQQSTRIASARSQWTSKPNARPLVCVSRSFKLWDDSGDGLARAIDADVIDVDDPARSAPAYLAEQAARASAIITANTGRADQADFVHAKLPWISWLTTSHVPAYVAGSPADGLIVADRALVDLACQRGWPVDRVVLGGIEPRVAGAGSTLALIADVPDLSPPKQIEDFSSWRLVWEAIGKDLLNNPHRLAGDVEGYLEKSRRHFGVPADDFPQWVFIDQLIAPAYLRGIGRWLIKEKLPVTIHGQGWSIGGVAPVRSRTAFDDMMRNSVGLIDAFIAPVHPSRQIGLPAVKTLGKTPQRIAQDIRNALAGANQADGSLPTIREVLGLLLAQRGA
jgi:hypothetical protein